MQTENTPQQDYNPKQLRQKIAEISEQIEDCENILNAKITLVIPSEDKERTKKALSLMMSFFSTNKEILTSIQNSLQQQLIMIKVGNVILERDTFIDEYYSIDQPGQLNDLDILDIDLLKQLQPAQSCAIRYNGITVSVTRIS